MSRGSPSRFGFASAVLAVVGCVAVVATPVVAGAGRASTGSVVTTGVLGFVFAARTLQLTRRGGVATPAAALTTAFDAWFVAAPLVYDVGSLATAGTQLGGLLTGALGAYAFPAGVTASG